MRQGRRSPCAQLTTATRWNSRKRRGSVDRVRMKKFYDEVAALIKANPALKDVELCATLLAVVAQKVEPVPSPDLRREMEEAIKKIFTQMLRDAMYRAALADVHCDAGQR